MPNFLGIDYGTKRIGLAWADDLGIALPLKAIRGTDFDVCLDELSKEIKERKIDQIVIGYPLHMNGMKGKRTEEVDQFVKILKANFALPIHHVDERLTSHAAEEALGKNAKSKKNLKSGKVDATAACLILKDFLSSDTGNNDLTFS
tara:strand:- start:1535 stop:1972 length:438 start_codon:yes stop_codon:yes gene_type:complete